MIFKYKQWRFFVYWVKGKRTAAVKPALSLKSHGDQIPPQSVVDLIQSCANLYFKSEQYAGMDIKEFLTKMLDENGN